MILVEFKYDLSSLASLYSFETILLAFGSFLLFHYKELLSRKARQIYRDLDAPLAIPNKYDISKIDPKLLSRRVILEQIKQGLEFKLGSTLTTISKVHIGLTDKLTIAGTNISLNEVMKYNEYGELNVAPVPLFRTVNRSLKGIVPRYWKEFEGLLTK